MSTPRPGSTGPDTEPFTDTPVPPFNALVYTLNLLLTRLPGLTELCAGRVTLSGDWSVRPSTWLLGRAVAGGAGELAGGRQPG